uniref:NB-ARC domain-containing protein n=1 Tax=Fagus sylvatica TaxID=28930 RepID=A0A2N9FCN5_FAGSY
MEAQAAISIGAKAGEHMVEPIKQQVGYLIHLNSNIKNLKDQFQKLGDKRHGLQLLIDEEKRKDLVIALEVEQWVQMVDNISQGLQRFIDEDKMCLDLKSRYSLSRKAKKKTLAIEKLLSDAPSHNIMSCPPPPQGIGSSSIEGFKDFESRISMIKEVLEALRDDNINMISICGMGGIGKTTMAKEVAKRAKEAKLFDEDVMAVVSQNQDVKHIQGQIADMLHLQLKAESSLEERANQNVGIPCGGQNKRCKILLTSRSEEACNQMRSQKIVPIKVLSEEEAWNLFREMAGDCVDTRDLHPIAKEVAKECGGLPVAIVTVGRALENKTKVEWIAALQQLKKSIPKTIHNLDSTEDYDIPIEYLVRYGVGRSWKEECVKMHDVVRDVAISIADEHGFLVGCDDKIEEWPEKDTYGNYVEISLFSQEMKKHPDGLECSKLELLQLSCGKDTPQIEEWPEKDTYGNYFEIFLFSQEMKKHPDSLECSKHELLQLSCGKDTPQTGADPGIPFRGGHVPTLVMNCIRPCPQMIPANMFQGMKELKVLSMRDVSAIGALGKLEMLSFLGSKIKELPREIGNLGHLKLLDLSKCSTLQRIPYGLLSSLSRLEELYMGGIVVKWEPLEGNGEGNASLAELNSLSHHLMALEIIIPSIKLLPKDLHFKNQMIKFHMDIDQNLRAAFPSLERLELTDLDNLEKIYDGQFPKRSFSARGLVQLQELKISDCRNLEEIFSKEGEDEKAVDMIKFPKLTHMGSRLSLLRRLIGFCKPIVDPVELVQPSHAKSTQPSSNLEVARMETNELTKDKMTDNQDTGSFPDHLFKIIFIQDHLVMCGRMFHEESSIEIEKCDMIEDIVQRDGEEEAADFALFPKVSSFIVEELPNLVTFCKEAYSLEWSSMRKIKIWSCNKFKTIGSEIRRPMQDSPGFLRRCLKCVPHSRNYGPMVESNRGTNNKSHGSSSVVSKESNLTKLEDPKARDIDNPSKIWYLFSSHIIECLKNLEEIELGEIQVIDCEKIEEILTRAREEEGEEKDIVLFNKVNLIMLMDLPNLKCFCNEANAFEWPSLKKVGVIRCPNLRTFVPANLKTPELEGVYEDYRLRRPILKIMNSKGLLSGREILMPP